MPRAKYTKPPGKLPAIEQVQRFEFQFRNHQRRKLTGLLPPKLTLLTAPSQYIEASKRPLKTIADVMVQATEEAINSHLTALPLTAEGRINPANMLAAILRLREALEPWTCGAVDDETADIVPADLDDKLAAREQQIAKLRLPPAKRRMLLFLCDAIRVAVTKLASESGETVSDDDLLRYIDGALSCAGIAHPDIAKHRGRLRALIFPPNN